MKSIVFHIGFPKTATTYLQKYIFPQLEKKDWLVVDPFFNNTNHYNEFRKNPNYFNQKQFENKNIFLSSEYLSDPFRDFNYNKAYLDMLDKIYEYPIFIIVTREDIINSLYLQTIKTGSSISASRFLEERKILNLDTTNFSELPHLCDLVLDFEELKSEPNTFLSRLKTFVDFDFQYVNKKDTNTSYGFISVAISKFLNLFFRSMNNPHGLIPLPYRHTHLFTFLRRYKWYRDLDKKKNYFKHKKEGEL